MVITKDWCECESMICHPDFPCSGVRVALVVDYSLHVCKACSVVYENAGYHIEEDDNNA